jgi:hypothetical protein
VSNRTAEKGKTVTGGEASEVRRILFKRVDKKDNSW